MYEAIFGRWAHTLYARLAVRAAIALAVLSFVWLAFWCALRIIESYWPKDKPLTVEEAFQVGQFVVLTLGLASVVLLWKQGKDSAKWNRLLSYHQFFPDCPSQERRAKMLEVVKKFGDPNCLKGRGQPVSATFVQKLEASADDRQAIMLYLDDFEQLCGAVNSEVLDEDYVRGLERTRVIRIFHVFKPVIDVQQVANPSTYLEFEKLASKWLAMRDKEEEDSRKDAQQRKLAGGVRPQAPSG